MVKRINITKVKVIALIFGNLFLHAACEVTGNSHHESLGPSKEPQPVTEIEDASYSAKTALNILNTANAQQTHDPVFLYTATIDENLEKTYKVEIAKLGYEIHQKNPGNYQKLNKLLADEVNQSNQKLTAILESQKSKRWPGVDQKKIQEIYQRLKEHKVAKLSEVKKYDKPGNVGFCHGRATAAHYMLIEEKVPQESILKVYALGRFHFFGVDWTYHMATAVKGNAGQWWVIDSIFEAPLEIKDWMIQVNERFSKQKSNRHTRFYTSDPRKFLPTSSAYKYEYFQNELIKTYYSDLFKSL